MCNLCGGKLVVTPMLLVATRARCEDEMAQTLATVVPVPGLALNVAAQLSVAERSLWLS